MNYLKIIYTHNEEEKTLFFSSLMHCSENYLSNAKYLNVAIGNVNVEAFSEEDLSSLRTGVIKAIEINLMSDTNVLNTTLTEYNSINDMRKEYVLHSAQINLHLTFMTK